MATQQKDLTKGSAVQILNTISIEYDFAVPTYTVKSLGLQQELPPFEATSEIFKNNITYTCVGEPASQKKAAKLNAAAKILEMISTRYVVLEEIEEKYLIPESKLFKISDKNSKETLQKWTHSCKRCFQRGDLAKNCRNPYEIKNIKNSLQYSILIRLNIYT